MPEYTESAIFSALEDIDKGISLRKAAQRWGIPRSTLHNRLNGIVTRNEANEHNQRLSKQQESHLVNWIISQGALGFAPTHQQVREFAARIVKAGGDDQPLGKSWIEGFLRRNPEVKTVRGIFLSSDDPGDQRHPPRQSLQYGRDGDPRGPRQQRASARGSQQEADDKETTWITLLDFNRRVYLSNRERLD